MRRWTFGVLILAAVIVLLGRQEDEVAVSEDIPQVSIGPVVERVPAQIETQKRVIPAKIRRIRNESFVKVDSRDVFPSENHDSFEQAGRQWSFVEGAVAVSENEERVRDLPSISKRAGFVILNQADVPAGVEAFGLVERADNKMLGIFTGVLKAMGKPILTQREQFQGQCPSEVVESFPAIQSYLLKTTSDHYQELKTCLEGTGLFQRLDWEILTAARMTH